MDYVVRNKWGFNASTGQIHEFFGIPPGHHLPDSHQEVVVQGHHLVLLTKAEARQKAGMNKKRPHRIMQLCPAGCGLIPVGRMHQHCVIHPDHEKKLAVRP